jgi:hypothetical protein
LLCELILEFPATKISSASHTKGRVWQMTSDSEEQQPPQSQQAQTDAVVDEETNPYVSLNAEEFDLVVVGTGLIECIVSAAAAQAGKKVLHTDERGYYGAQNCSMVIRDIREASSASE